TAQYDALGRPRLEEARLVRQGTSERGVQLAVGDSSWLLDIAPKKSGAIYRALDPEISNANVHLLGQDGDMAAVTPYVGKQILNHGEGEDLPPNQLTTSQRRLVTKVRRQIKGSKHGIFPWNLEAYDDVDAPPDGLRPPLTSVYCVAAGFKPYRILHTHGFDSRTRVGLFDYSPRALEFRHRLIRDWDGTDYPAFLQKAFRDSPPDTYFQLWAGLSPAEVAPSDVERLWRAETDRWGGEETFQKNWNLCRSLP